MGRCACCAGIVSEGGSLGCDACAKKLCVACLGAHEGFSRCTFCRSISGADRCRPRSLTKTWRDVGKAVGARIQVAALAGDNDGVKWVHGTLLVSDPDNSFAILWVTRQSLAQIRAAGPRLRPAH